MTQNSHKSATRSLTVLGALSFVLFALLLVQWQLQGPRNCSEEILEVFRAADSVARDFSAGNSTLGFNAILALSQGTRWRVDGLHAAARASGIDVQIPQQPGWSDPFIRSFQEFGPVKAHGAAMAWLGHIDILKFVIQNGWGSALILEDDVDWDVNIRNQTLLIAKAVLTLTNHEKILQAPYGLDWDVLWMGHCSDPADFNRPHVLFEDPTVIPLDRYVGLNTGITTVLKDGQRCVNYSQNPVCTFAYAVSARGARKLLNQASMGRGGAFDLMLMHACQGKVLKCVSVNPEIFSPYHPAEGEMSEVRAGDNGETVDQDVSRSMGETYNIRQSTRCSAIFHSTCLPEGARRRESNLGVGWGLAAD